MLANYRRTYICFMLALVVGMLLPMATPQAAYAQEEEYGYLWSLEFDFDSSFDGVLTIEVGPWKDGDLAEVDETSQETVHCLPAGDVILDSGDAVFSNQGYLRCSMNLAEIVMDNHGLEIEPIDSYGSLLMTADLNSDAIGYAPIFSHHDASYGVKYNATQAVTFGGQLSTWKEDEPSGSVAQFAIFPGVTINTWNSYLMEYACGANGGPCDALLKVNGQQQTFFNLGGRSAFATEEASFLIGHDGGSYFSGRMGHLLVDPGNSAH